jgi:hypothetical protein
MARYSLILKESVYHKLYEMTNETKSMGKLINEILEKVSNEGIPLETKKECFLCGSTPVFLCAEHLYLKKYFKAWKELT